MKQLNNFTRIGIITMIVFASFGANSQIYLDLADKGTLTFKEIVAQTEAHFDIVGRDKGMGYKPFKRWEYEMQRSLDKRGYIVSKKRQAESYQQFMKTNSTPRNVDFKFVEMGPVAATNTSTWSSSLGRLSALGLDVNDENHMIVGAPTGGIWRTTDKGASWKVIYEYATTIDIASLEISHANADHYWAGTADGIIRSIDAGKTWTAVVGGPAGEVNTITMDPTNANVLLATLRSAGGGVYRSIDGGQNWAMVHNPGNSAYDIEFKPGASNTVYASGEGFIAKSNDNGATWVNIAGGPWNAFGVIMMAVTPANGNYVYALQENGLGGYEATYRSTNSGTAWTTQSDNTSGMNNILTYDQSVMGGQAPRDMDITISPTNANEVYVAGTELWKSTNGGAGFIKIADWLVNSALPFIHADVDLLYYTADGLFACTDGGLFISNNAGTSFTDYTPGIGVRQFYRIGASATDPDRVSGGSQDNGVGVVVNGEWRDYMGADGMETFIDWSNADIMYGNTQNGGLSKSIDGGLTTTYISNSPGTGEWITPTEQDPSNSNTLYHGKAELYKSTDGAQTWNAISNFANGDEIDEVEIAPSNNQIIFIAYDNILYKTINGGTTWNDVSPNMETINYIDVHPTNPNKVLITQMGKVMESSNGGTTWTEITSNLPTITYYCGIYQGDATNGIFLAGRYGIWHKDDNSAGNWLNVNGDLPIVQVRELEIRGNTMYVGTYGRGLWKGKVNNNSNYGMTCADAIEINLPGSYTAPGPSYGGGCQNCSNGAAHANWFKFTPPLSGQVQIGSCNAGVDTRVWVYSGSCTALTQIADSDDDCSITYGSGSLFASLMQNIPVVAGVPIYIEWDNRWSASSFHFNIEYTTVNCPPNLSGANALAGLQNKSVDFEAAGTISSSQTVAGVTTVVDYDSGTDINLNPNFEVVLGAQFNAFIDGCGGAQAQGNDD
jgi:photosystem II stability/assembly factor-like uncharacterized protein